MSRCKQSSNQSQPIVILMLVRLNGKSVYRSFLSLCHTHAHSLSLSPLRLVPLSSSTLFQGQVLYSFSFLYLVFSISSILGRRTLNDRQRTCKSLFFFFSAGFCRNASVDNKTCPRDERSCRKRNGDALGNVDMRISTHEVKT